ncbi:hypothetical protein [Riemerella anatipestifer]|uniref:hypothetical protein n=1 Tax=Riemerella anatipestifer TaxID=34085 RepID=UPI00129EA11B|nr:hypothetical protein [Riemerella anatipestifer]
MLKQWVFFNAFTNEVLNAVGLRGQIYYIYYKHSSPKDHLKLPLIITTSLLSPPCRAKVSLGNDPVAALRAIASK